MGEVCGQMGVGPRLGAKKGARQEQETDGGTRGQTGVRALWG